MIYSTLQTMLIFVTMQIKTQSEPIWNKESVKTRTKRRIELVLLPGLITFVPPSLDKANDKESAFDTISYLERQIWEKRGEDEFCSTTRGQGNKEASKKRMAMERGEWIRKKEKKEGWRIPFAVVEVTEVTSKFRGILQIAICNAAKENFFSRVLSQNSNNARNEC